MKRFFAYTRVSTTKQGETGVSLQEQRSAIERYAREKEITISDWFEEQLTAAKRGRPVFSRMIRQLKLRQAAGVVIHKIDRSARNLRDWADIGELVDAGVQIHFSNEPLDLNSRGGRLSADIQAVIASDFIRNLREETKKGFYGRLKQGLYPMPAPLGYLNAGRGKVKIPDPAKAPLIRQCFDLYATGCYTIVDLAEEMFRRGLRSKSGKRIGWHGISKILKRVFYTGAIVLEKNGESFVGGHKPLVSGHTFREVQDLMSGKSVKTRVLHHDYLFRQVFNCCSCGKVLIGERQKGAVYYRCHGKQCPGGTIREDRIQDAITTKLKCLDLSSEESLCLGLLLKDLCRDSVEAHERAIAATEMSLSKVKEREARLTDVYLDGAVDDQTYRERIAALRVERCDLENRLKDLKGNPSSLPNAIMEVLELAKSAYSTYIAATIDESKELLKVLCSNRTLDPKNPVFTMDPAFERVANRNENSIGSPSASTSRTEKLCKSLVKDLASLVRPTLDLAPEPRLDAKMPDAA